MFMMSLVFSLPFDLIYDLLDTWLNVQEWTKLDSAATSKHRQTILFVLGKLKCSFKHMIKGCDIELFLNWIKCRGIKARELLINGKQWNETIFMNLDVSELKCLLLSVIIFDSNIIKFINNCKSLTGFIVRDCTCAISDAIVSIASQLTSLEIAWSISVLTCLEESIIHITHLKSLILQNSLFMEKFNTETENKFVDLIQRNKNLLSLEIILPQNNTLSFKCILRLPQLSRVILQFNELNYEMILSMVKNNLINSIVCTDCRSRIFQFSRETEKRLNLNNVDCTDYFMIDVLYEMNGLSCFVFTGQINIDILENLLARNASTLKELKMKYCSCITSDDSNLKDFFPQLFSEVVCFNLIELEITGSFVELSSIGIILDKCPNISQLTLIDCVSLVEEDVTSLIQSKGFNVNLRFYFVD